MRSEIFDAEEAAFDIGHLFVDAVCDGEVGRDYGGGGTETVEQDEESGLCEGVKILRADGVGLLFPCFTQSSTYTSASWSRS